MEKINLCANEIDKEQDNCPRVRFKRKHYFCEKCQKVFSQKSNWTRHLNTHSGKKPFACDKCQKTFSQKIHLDEHQFTHSGIKPYACEHCQVTFSNRSSLNRHLKSHSGVKPFICDHCQKSFSHKMALILHVRTHTGIPYRVKWQNFINTFSDFLFYSLTTLSGFQTLGEEYVNVLQVDGSLKKIPPKWKRLVDILLQTVGCYSVMRLQKMIENQVNLFAAVAEKYGNRSPEASVVAYLPLVFKFITFVQRIHLIIFYFHGSYYTIPKRLAGIRYVLIRRWLAESSYQKPLKILGCVAASQLCLGIIVAFYSFKLSNSLMNVIQVTQKENSHVSDGVNPRNQCALCLENRNHSTATPCGHLFCWPCITSWMQSKEECPLCRERFPASTLVFLHNY